MLLFSPWHNDKLKLLCLCHAQSFIKLIVSSFFVDLIFSGSVVEHVSFCSLLYWRFSNGSVFVCLVFFLLFEPYGVFLEGLGV